MSLLINKKKKIPKQQQKIICIERNLYIQLKKKNKISRKYISPTLFSFQNMFEKKQNKFPLDQSHVY